MNSRHILRTLCKSQSFKIQKIDVQSVTTGFRFARQFSSPSIPQAVPSHSSPERPLQNDPKPAPVHRSLHADALPAFLALNASQPGFDLANANRLYERCLRQALENRDREVGDRTAIQIQEHAMKLKAVPSPQSWDFFRKGLLSAAKRTQNYNFVLSLFKYCSERLDAVPLHPTAIFSAFSMFAASPVDKNRFYKFLDFIDLLRKIGGELAPTLNMYTAAVNQALMLDNIRIATTLLGQIAESGLVPDIITINALISALAKSGKTREALDVFCVVREWGGLELNQTTYNVVLSALQRAKMGEDVVVLVKELEASGVELSADGNDIVLHALLISEMLPEFTARLRVLRSRGVPVNPRLFHQMALLASDKKSFPILALCHDLMQESKVVPDPHTLNITITTGLEIGRPELPLKIIDSLNMEQVNIDWRLGQSLIRLFGVTGRPDKAREILNTHVGPSIGGNDGGMARVAQACFAGNLFSEALALVQTMKERTAATFVLGMEAACQTKDAGAVRALYEQARKRFAEGALLDINQLTSSAIGCLSEIGELGETEKTEILKRVEVAMEERQRVKEERRAAKQQLEQQQQKRE